MIKSFATTDVSASTQDPSHNAWFKTNAAITVSVVTGDVVNLRIRGYQTNLNINSVGFAWRLSTGGTITPFTAYNNSSDPTYNGGVNIEGLTTGSYTFEIYAKKLNDVNFNITYPSTGTFPRFTIQAIVFDED